MRHEVKKLPAHFNSSHTHKKPPNIKTETQREEVKNNNPSPLHDTLVKGQYKADLQ